MVETFTRNDVFLVDWDFFGGGRLIFFQRLMFSHGIRIIPSELSFLSGCSRFSRGWEVKYFLEKVQFFLERIHLKISIFS